MKDIFLADAHLVAPKDENYQTLLAFLSAQQGEIRTLYLLGDLFEFWAGNRRHIPAPYQPIVAALRQLHESGTEIIYVEGNHDFALGIHFCEAAGCRLLPDGGEVKVNGLRVHVAHGDLVNPDDHGYRLLRRTLRTPLLRLLLRLLPFPIIWGMARWGSSQSRKSHNEKTQRWVPEVMLTNYAKEKFEKGVDAVITGHFHAPLQREEGGKVLLALGDWIDQYSYAVYEKGQFKLCRWSQTPQDVPQGPARSAF